jgi:parvulin-like peptidyl-prolyl isomerase
MSFRNRPTLDRKHRPRWQDELRSQQLIVAGFAVAIAIAVGIFGATAWSSYYDNHLREVAFVGGTSFDKDALAKRRGIINAELQAKLTDLTASAGGANDSTVQQQIKILQQTLQSLDATAGDSLTTGAFMRADSSALSISVTSDAIDKEVANRTTLPFQVQLSIITVNALPANSSATAKPTAAQWAAAEKQANSLLADLKGGKDFATLAKAKSADTVTKTLGGLVGWVKDGDPTYETIFAAAKNAKAGDLLGPIKGDVDYTVLKVDKVRKAAPNALFSRLLSSVPATDADYHDYIRDELLASAYQTYFGTKVLSKYMPQKHVAQIQIQPDGGAPVPQDRVRHILVQPEPGADDQTKATAAEWAAALAKAKAARAALVKPGASWTSVAKTYSDDPGSKNLGGDIGWLDPASAQVVPEFLKAIQTLRLNQISEPVKSQYGYHIIQVFELRSSAAGQAVTLEDELKKDPGSFAKVAARESADHATADKGGDIGWVAPFEKSKPLEDAIFKLTTVGQISAAAMDTDGTIFIFKLLETSPYRYVEADRLSTITSTGFAQWRDKLKGDLGYWIDPQYTSTATTTTS